MTITDPISEERLPCAITTFVDDIAIKVKAANRYQFMANMQHTDHRFKLVLGPFHIAQNDAKAQSIRFTAGKGTQKFTSSSTNTTSTPWILTARYLGPRLHHRGSSKPEIRTRIEAAQFAHLTFWRL